MTDHATIRETDRRDKDDVIRELRATVEVLRALLKGPTGKEART